MAEDRRWTDSYAAYGDYEKEVARGNVHGAFVFPTYGKATFGAASANVYIQPQLGSHFPTPQGVQMSVVSTSADDSAAGTGARTVVIEYLNGNLDTSFEIVTLNGLTPVLTQATDIRFVQAMQVATFGSLLLTAGTVTVIQGGYTYCQIGAGERTHKSSFRRVPRGKRLMVSSFFAGSNSGTSAARALIQFCTSQIDGLDQQETGIIYAHVGVELQDNSLSVVNRMPFPVSEGHIVGFVASTDKAATLTAGFTGWIENV